MKDEIEALVNAIAGRLGLRGDEAAKAIEQGGIALNLTERAGARLVRATYGDKTVEIDMADVATAIRAKADSR
jgi:hypothetical protein